MLGVESAFARKAHEFESILKIGRTQLQDAVPMTLGQEFGAYATAISEDIDRVVDVRARLREIHLGGTAIGTGLNVHPDYPATVRMHLSQLTGIAFVPSRDFIEATQDTGSLVDVSAVLRRVAVRISKVCNDLRLLSSGPRCGIGELSLPAVQAGSSMMPGKVNPVIPEVVTQVAFEIIGADVTVGLAAEAAQLQLNAFEPVVAHVLFRGIARLSAALDILSTRCVDGITANTEKLSSYVDASASIVTALTPYIGYARAATLSNEALNSGTSIRELVAAQDLVPGVDLTELLRPETFMRRPPVAVDRVEPEV
jgi:aspartate ammonia-lyase